MFRRPMLFGLGILGLALLVGTSESQEKKTKGQLPPGWKDLNLTAAQKEKVYEINAEFKKKIDDLNKQIKTLQQEHKKAQVAVLTDEQKEQLQKIVIGETKKKDDKKSDKKDDKKSDK